MTQIHAEYDNLKPYLSVTDIIDWQQATIAHQAQALARGCESDEQIAQRCFTWVRDHIRHSMDYQLDTITCTASEVLQHRSGFCFAKSHLLAALLRANALPTGFCYQRLSLNDDGAPYSLHGFNAVHLKEHGWYRMDARGNKAGVDAQFTPPQEQLAFAIKDDQEFDFAPIYAQPLDCVIEALQGYHTRLELCDHLPDIPAPTQAMRSMND